MEYDNFFNPLCCKNKRIYYECILQNIEKSKSVPLLYESDARDTLILYLRNYPYAVEDEVASSIADENISSEKSENENASAILRYKVIEAIERIFNRDNRAALTNHRTK